MQLTDILAHTGGLNSMARELGISEGLAAQGTEALLPAILGGFKTQVKTREAGIEGLAGLLGQLGGGGLLDDLLAPEPTHVDRGNAVLGQIFGSKDVSRAVAQNAASRTGLRPELLKKMLPMVAMLVAGYMSKRQAGLTATESAGKGGGLLDTLFGRKEAPGGTLAAQPGLASMLDLDGDGNPLDDILKLAGRALR